MEILGLSHLIMVFKKPNSCGATRTVPPLPLLWNCTDRKYLNAYLTYYRVYPKAYFTLKFFVFKTHEWRFDLFDTKFKVRDGRLLKGLFYHHFLNSFFYIRWNTSLTYVKQNISQSFFFALIKMYQGNSDLNLCLLKLYLNAHVTDSEHSLFYMKIH